MVSGISAVCSAGAAGPATVAMLDAPKRDTPAADLPVTGETPWASEATNGASALTFAPRADGAVEGGLNVGI